MVAKNKSTFDAVTLEQSESAPKTNSIKQATNTQNQNNGSGSINAHTHTHTLTHHNDDDELHTHA